MHDGLAEVAVHGDFNGVREFRKASGKASPFELGNAAFRYQRTRPVGLPLTTLGLAGADERRDARRVSSGGTRHEKAHPCHRCRGRLRRHPTTRLSDAPGRSPDHGFDRNGQSDDVRNAGGCPGPATRPDDSARTAGPVHGRHVPVLPEHGHDAAPAATAGRHAGHARDAEHARHAAGCARKSSGAIPGTGNAEAELTRVGRSANRRPAVVTIPKWPCAASKGRSRHPRGSR
jgi:hypothetical protein